MDTLEIVTVHEADLQAPRQSGGRLRAVCHLHGGDHQRSLSIALDGDAAGYGFCHACSVKVFVPELAPTGQARGARFRPTVTAERLLRPRRAARSIDPTPEPWQRDELATLERLAERMRARLTDDRPREYLEGRGIPWDIARDAGVGYVPADAKLSGSLAKWRDRLTFPLGSPAGAGYAGRSVWGWEPGMDENQHKAHLEATPDAPRRWEKTYPAGWYGYDELVATTNYVVVCEGPFDRLALVAAGLGLAQVVALVGTAARAEWIPSTVRGVVLALDGDAAGVERARILRHELRAAGLDATLCTPPQDGRGKDWAERWRLAQWDGVLPVLEALDAYA